MKATVTRTWTLDDEQIKRFMLDSGNYEEGEYTDDDVADELDATEACELDEYGTCDFFSGHDVDVTE